MMGVWVDVCWERREGEEVEEEGRSSFVLSSRVTASPGELKLK